MDDKTVIRFPNDNTVIRPRPGGKRTTSTGNAPQVKNSEQKNILRSNLNPTVIKDSSCSPHIYNERFNIVSDPNLTSDVRDFDSNQILYCASTLVSLIIKLSNSSIHNDIAQLKIKLQDEIKQFEVRAGRLQIPGDTILQARYILCTTLDEMVVSTPWGQDSDWSQQSLLSIFHGETWGGEKFYLLLERLQKESSKNLQILELMYICISLGFQGKYRVIENGYGEVEVLREDLYRLLRGLKRDFNKELSNNWRGISDNKGALIRYVPLWVVGAISGVVLLAMFSSFTYMLDQSSSPVMSNILKLGPDISDQVKPSVKSASSKVTTYSSINSSPIILKATSNIKGGRV